MAQLKWLTMVFMDTKSPRALTLCSPLPEILSVASNKWDSLRSANDLLACKPHEALEDVCLIMDKYRVYYSFSCVCEVQILKQQIGCFLVFGFFLVYFSCYLQCKGL